MADQVPEQADSENETGEDRVGYCRPPVHSRFRPGQSGNPKGRPRGRRSTASILRDLMAEKIAVSVNGRKKRVTVVAAMLLRQRELALKGDLKAAKLLLDMLRGYHGEEEADGTDRPLSDEDMEILASAGLLPSPEAGDDIA